MLGSALSSCFGLMHGCPEAILAPPWSSLVAQVPWTEAAKAPISSLPESWLYLPSDLTENANKVLPLHLVSELLLRGPFPGPKG
jgi:hypothetical protein